MFVFAEGPLSFFHFDLAAQALAKVGRGLPRDVADVQALLERELVSAADLRDYLALVQPHLYRHPQLDAAAVRAAVDAVTTAP